MIVSAGELTAQERWMLKRDWDRYKQVREVFREEAPERDNWDRPSILPQDIDSAADDAYDEDGNYVPRALR